MSLENFIQTYGGLTQSYKFYDDSIELRFDIDEHKYFRLEGNDFIETPSVTQVVHIIDKSGALVPWAAKMVAERILQTTPAVSRLAITETSSICKWFVELPLDEFTAIVLNAKSAPRDVKEDAGDIGHMAHDWLEKYIKSVLAENEPSKLELLAHFPENEKAASCCVAALDWMEAHNVRWIKTERKIYSREYGYAGTLDGLAVVDSCEDAKCCPNVFNDHLSLIDWKSSNHLYAEYLLQTAAYQQAEQEEFEIPIDDRWIIRLGKEDGEFETWFLDSSTFTADFEAFRYALYLSRSMDTLQTRMKIKYEFKRSEEKKAKKEVKEVMKAEEKAAKASAKQAFAMKKEAEKQAQWAIKCKGADKYKGVKPPKCNKGNPCHSCLAIYAEQERLRGLAKKLLAVTP